MAYGLVEEMVIIALKQLNDGTKTICNMFCTIGSSKMCPRN